MLTRRFLLLALVLATSLAAQTRPTKQINGDIWDGNGGPLTDKFVYEVVNAVGGSRISVPTGQTLTINKGAILKFSSNKLQISGVVVCKDGATFTSIHDDSRGGDTNGNGGLTTASKGDWEGIVVHGPGSDIERSTIQWAGHNFHAGLWIRGDHKITFNYNQVFDCGGHGVDLEKSDSTFKYCTINRCTGIAAIGLFEFANHFAYNKASQCGKNYMLYVTGQQGYPFPKTLVLHSGNPIGAFVLALGGLGEPTHLTVPAGSTLNVGDCTFKFKSSNTGVSILGEANFTNCSLTSIHDDTLGGDTNGNGTGTSPSKHDWFGIEASQTGVLNGTNSTIRYAGPMGGIHFVDQSHGTLDGCKLESSAGDGVNISHTGNKVSGIAFKPFTFKGCSFTDNNGIAVRGIDFMSLATCSSNTATNNQNGDFFSVIPRPLSFDVAVSRRNVPGAVIVIEGWADLEGPGVLTLRANTILKFNPGGYLRAKANSGGVIVRGSGRRGVVFTSIADDLQGGDTNKDGSISSPAPGDWKGITIMNGAGASEFDTASFYFGESGLILLDAKAKVKNSSSESNSWYGYELYQHSGDLIGLIARNNVKHGIWSNIAHSFYNCTSINNGQYGFSKNRYSASQVQNCLMDGNSWGSLEGHYKSNDVTSSWGAYKGQNGNQEGDPKIDTSGRPAYNSPLVDAGTNHSISPDGPEGSPRTLDGNLDMLPIKDIGAFEFMPFSSTMTGETQIGQTSHFTINGNIPGSSTGLSAGLLGLGTQPQMTPWGELLTGIAPLLTVGTAPVGQPITLSIPNSPNLAGGRFVIQFFVAPQGKPFVMSSFHRIVLD